MRIGSLALGLLCGLVLMGQALHAQTIDSLRLEDANGNLILSESEIAAWPWPSPAIELQPAVGKRLDSITLTSDRWKMLIGNTRIYEGYFVPLERVDHAFDTLALPIHDDAQGIYISKSGSLRLIFVQRGHPKNRILHCGEAPLYNPILLDHLVARNLIPAEYRLRLLFRAIGLPWPGKR